MNGRLPSAFALAVLCVVAILVVPLPPPLLDVLLAFNVFGSALVLLISLRVEEPLEFSAFAPSLLLATLFRLYAYRKFVFLEPSADGDDQADKLAPASVL